MLLCSTMPTRAYFPLLHDALQHTFMFLWGQSQRHTWISMLPKKLCLRVWPSWPPWHSHLLVSWHLVASVHFCIKQIETRCYSQHINKKQTYTLTHTLLRLCPACGNIVINSSTLWLECEDKMTAFWLTLWLANLSISKTMKGSYALLFLLRQFWIVLQKK